MKFVVRQFFLRDYPEEKAMLEALAEPLAASDGLVTFNGKTFDVPPARDAVRAGAHEVAPGAPRPFRCAAPEPPALEIAPGELPAPRPRRSLCYVVG